MVAATHQARLISIEVDVIYSLSACVLDVHDVA